MEDNLILEGLLSMVTELKEKLEAQVTPASREETLERLGTIEQALSELHSNSAVPEEKLQVIQSQLDDIRSRMQDHSLRMIRGGGATTVEPAGTSVWTTAPAPILTPSPIRMPPTTTAPAPIRQFRPICGAFPSTSPMVTF